jgi:hypothetical protein
MGSIHCPETSVNNYHTTPRNFPEERRFHQHRGGSLESNSAVDDRCNNLLTADDRYNNLLTADDQYNNLLTTDDQYNNLLTAA